MITFLSSIWDGIDFTDDVGLPVTIILIAAIVLIAVAVNVVPRLVHKWEIEYRTRDLTYGAICLAMSYALSWLKLFEMPLGGSVTPAALAPAYIYCYYFGFRKGMIFAAASMLLQFTQPVYICHPLSAFFDYLLPYFSLCIVGLFRYRKERYAAFIRKGEGKGGLSDLGRTLGGHWPLLVGALLHMAVRYASSVISGVICWDYWGYEAAATAYKFTFSLGYNASLLVDCAIAIVAAAALMSSRTLNVYLSAAFDDKTSLASNGAPRDETPPTQDEEPAPPDTEEPAPPAPDETE